MLKEIFIHFFTFCVLFVIILTILESATFHRQK